MAHIEDYNVPDEPTKRPQANEPYQCSICIHCKIDASEDIPDTCDINDIELLNDNGICGHLKTKTGALIDQLAIKAHVEQLPETPTKMKAHPESEVQCMGYCQHYGNDVDEAHKGEPLCRYAGIHLEICNQICQQIQLINEPLDASRLYKKLPFDICDVYISEWILDNFNKNITFITEGNDKGQFYIFDGATWQQDRTKRYQEFIITAIKKVVEILTLEASQIENKFNVEGKPTIEYKNALDRLKKAKKYLDYRNIQGIWNIMKGRVAKDSRKFNKNYNLLNMQNGTFEIDAWKLREHRAEDNFTKIMPVEYRPGLSYKKSKFMQEVERSFPVPEEQLYIQVLFGRSLKRNTVKQITSFWGQTDAGKTTLLNAVLKTIGDEPYTGYGISLNPDAFTEAKAKQTTRNDLLMTRDCCLIGIDEPKTNTRQDTNILKAYSGGSGFTVRGLYSADERIGSSCTMINTCNTLPHLDVTDTGMLSRIVIVPFEYEVKEKIDEYWNILYMEESSLILNWLLNGLKYHIENGMPALPDRFRKATCDYIKENNIVDRFVATSAITGDEKYCRVTWANFNAAFIDYCKNSEGINERYIIQKNKIIEILSKMDVTLKDVAKIPGDSRSYRNVLMGIRLKTESELIEPDIIENVENNKNDINNTISSEDL